MKIGCWSNRKDNAIDTEKQANVYFMNLIDLVEIGCI